MARFSFISSLGKGDTISYGIIRELSDTIDREWACHALSLTLADLVILYYPI